MNEVDEIRAVFGDRVRYLKAYTRDDPPQDGDIEPFKILGRYVIGPSETDEEDTSDGDRPEGEII